MVIRRRHLLVSLLVIPSCGGEPQADRPASSAAETAKSTRTATPAADTLRKVLDELHDATVRRDSATIGRLLDDSYVGIGPLGDTTRAQQVIAEITDESAGRYDSLVNTRVPVIRVQGNTAAVSGQMLVHGVQKGQVFIHRADYSYRLIRRDGMWRVIFEQFTHAQ